MSADKTDHPKPASPATVKKDADGSFATSQADSGNNGALAIDPGTDDPTGKSDRRPEQTPEQKSRE